MALRFVFVSKKNYGWYEKYLVNNEKFFNPKLRTPKCEYRKVIDDDSNVSILLFNHNFVGHVMGYRDKDDSFYIFSVLVVPKFRGKGYAKILFDKIVYHIKVQGYEYLTGHFNKKSINLLSKNNIIFKGRFYRGYAYAKQRIES